MHRGLSKQSCRAFPVVTIALNASLIESLFFSALPVAVRSKSVMLKIYERTQLCALFVVVITAIMNLFFHLNKRYYSDVIYTFDNPRCLWQTVNKLLFRKSLSPLPSLKSFTLLACTFASFFTDKISTSSISCCFFPLRYFYFRSFTNNIELFFAFRPVTDSEI